MARFQVTLALLLALAAAAASISSPAQAQSFNCLRASSPDEVLICQSPRLRELDERMASIYFRVRNSLYGGARRDLEAEQAAWLRGRIGCGRDYGCIASAYRQRIRELLAY
jgi:uncharacterized protein